MEWDGETETEREREREERDLNQIIHLVLFNTFIQFLEEGFILHIPSFSFQVCVGCTYDPMTNFARPTSAFLYNY